MKVFEEQKKRATHPTISAVLPRRGVGERNVGVRTTHLYAVAYTHPTVSAVSRGEWYGLGSRGGGRVKRWTVGRLDIIARMEA